MKTSLFFLTLLAASPAAAQQTDTLSTDSVRRLKEVTVEGVRIQHKVDRQLIFPSTAIKKNSEDGYELLRRLQIPELKVNTAEHTISSLRGGDVQVRINDVKATMQDILSLRPDEVVRVEYIDNPGVRYAEDNLDAVINYIVKRRFSGYAGGLSTTQAFTTGFNNSNAYFKYNHKKSEFSLNYLFSYRNYDKQNTTTETTYLFPDGTEKYRNYEGFDNPMMYAFNDLQAAWNLASPDHYTLNVRFDWNWNNAPYSGPIQRVIESGQPDRLQYNRTSRFPKTPSLDIYYSVKLPHNQTLAANMVGTYIRTTYNYNMHEYLFNRSLEETLQGRPVQDYSYSTRGRKYSLISEALYMKEFKHFAITGGVNYTVSHTNNQYTGTVNTDAVLNSDNMYTFAQIQGKLSWLNYQLGTGVSYVSIRQEGIGFSRWLIRPQLTLSTNAIPNLSIRYTGRVSPQIPSLASLSEVRQQSNDLEVNDGNSTLVPYNAYKNSLTVTWSRPAFNLMLNGQIIYGPDYIGTPVTPLKQKDGSWMLSWKPENLKRATTYFSYASLTLHPIKDKLDLQVYGSWVRYEARGHSFSHNFVNWNYGATLNLMLDPWSLTYDFSPASKSLDTETISGGENSSDVSLSYKYKTLRLSLGCLLLGYPGGYKYTSETESRYYRSNSYTTIRNNGNMLYFRLSWNFSHGRTYKSGERHLNNSDSDSGIK